MKRLTISGIIAPKSEAAAMAPGEKSFGFDDLQTFLDKNGDEPFEIILDSIGGSVDEGFKIYNALKGLEVTTTALTANSIASVIFMAGKVRRVTPTSQMIIHNAWVDAGELSGEKLNVHTLDALKDVFEKTDAQILQVYTEVTGKDKESTLLALMASETDLGANKALALGLATELVEDLKAVTLRNKVLTFSRNQLDLLQSEKETIKLNLIKTEMQHEEKLNAFEKMLNGLKNLFKASMKNLATVTKDGVAIFIAGAEDGELVGKTVYLAEDGMPTEQLAPEGEHVLEDGMTVVLDATGVITEVKPAVDVEDLAAKMEEKEKALQAKEAEIMDLKNQIKALKESDSKKAAALEGLKKEFLSLKNQITGDPDEKKEDAEGLSAEEFAKLSPSEKIRLRAMNKAVK
jgi:ATP-dependent protease ClpP protease subunit